MPIERYDRVVPARIRMHQSTCRWLLIASPHTLQPGRFKQLPECVTRRRVATLADRPAFMVLHRRCVPRWLSPGSFGTLPTIRRGAIRQ